MNTLHNVAALATPLVGLAFTSIAGYVAHLLRNDRKAGQVVAAAVPVVEAVAADVEKVPAVEHVVEDVEAKVRAEAERLNAATHGAIDVLAAELAKAIPAAIQSAIVEAHASVPAPEAASQPPAAPSEPASAGDVPAEAVAGPVAPSAGPVVTVLPGSAPAWDPTTNLAALTYTFPPNSKKEI